MKRKLLSLMLCVSMAASLVACQGTATTESESVSSTETEETAETAETAETVQEETTEENGQEENEEDETQEKEEQASLMGYNMVADGDFSAGEEKWSLYLNAGTASMNYDNEQINVQISSVGKEEHGVQIYYDGFTLESGCVYEIQFDASSTVEREIQYRSQINGGDYHAYNGEYLTLTPEMQHFDIKFTMEEGSDPAPRLCMNMGYIKDNDPGEHTIVFDNFDYQCIDESGRIKPESAVETPSIQINQIGYRPEDDKKAVFCGDDIDSTFRVVDAKSGDSVYDGSVQTAAVNKNTKTNEAVADFSDLKTPGTYKVVGDKCGESYEFTIGEGIYDDAFADAVRMLYMQRCGEELTEEYAEDFAHPVCHAEKATIYGTSDKIDVSGGWHDAGDYGRYTVSGVKAVADILLAYEKYPEAFGDDLNIPESGNGIPDVLDEARYELEWLFKMQAADGGVYHKVTCANFPETVMPQEEVEELLVLPVSTTATGDFAAVMAMAYGIYQDVDSAFADQCLTAAKKAAVYLDNNENQAFTNPEDVVTGEYPDNFDEDERFWAYAELFKATGENVYEEAVANIDLEKVKYGLGWADVGYYAAYAYLTSDGTDSALQKAVMAKMDDGAAEIVKNIGKDTYGCSIFKDYVWGSNMLAANNGMMLSLYGEVADKDYTKETKAQLDYLFGNNGNSYCFLTGYGTLYPEGTHHRPSQALGKTLKGMLVGGPNAGLDDPYAAAVLKGKPQALCYVDNSQSYSCNEITVYWNSPLIYLLAEAK